MRNSGHCPECGTRLPLDGARGLCPQCAVQSAAEPSGAGEPLTAVAAGARAFGDYELLEEIGRGGMGVVFRARQISLNRLVAVKLILSGEFASEQEVLRFRSEAAVAASLRHRAIVAIYETGECVGQHYFSMDLVAGRNLAEIVRDGPLPARRAAQYVETVAEAIHYAHGQGILHRDLKPSNVLIDADDQPRITDFGLAKRVVGDFGLTVTGQVLGSPNFMPPEQCGIELPFGKDLGPPTLAEANPRPGADIITPPGSKARVGPWSDVYGLGAMLYHLLTGRPPFQAETIGAVLRLVHEEEPVSPRALNASVPKDLETICLKCLEKKLEKRYRTAFELAAELGRFLRGEPVQARPVGPLEKAWRCCGRKPALASSLVAVALLLGVIAAGSPIALWRIKRAQFMGQQDLYVAWVALANEALTAYNLPRARSLLERVTTSAQQRDMRGWEWRHLNDRCRSGEIATLGRHDSWIMGLALSADDQWAACIGEDGWVKLWDLPARQEVDLWRAHNSVAPTNRPGFPGHSLAISPDNQTLATGGADGSVHLWRIVPRQRTAVLPPLNASCTALAFSPSGQLLAAVSIQGELSLWDLSPNPPVLLTRTNSGANLVYTLTIAPSGKSLAIAGYQQKVRLWDISSPSAPRELRPLEDTGWPAAMSPDGKWIAAVDFGGYSLRRWDLATGREQPRWLARHAEFVSLAFSPDSLVLASGLADGQIVLWDMTDQREPVTLVGHEDFVVALAFSRNGRTLLSASLDHTVRLWDAARPERSGRAASHGFAAVDVCFSPDSRYLASVGREQIADTDGVVRRQLTVKLWDVASMREITNAATGGKQMASYPAFSPDGKLLAVDDRGTTLRLYTVPDLRCLNQFDGFSPAFLPNGRGLLYASGRRIIQRESPADPGAAETVLGELSARLTSVVLSPDGRTVACSTFEAQRTRVLLFDVAKRRLLANLPGHQGGVSWLAFSPDGQRLASASWDGQIGIWDVGQRRLIDLLRGHTGEVYGVDFAPDGRTIASCGADATIRLWHAGTLQEIAALRRNSRLFKVSFSPDGRWLAAAAMDGGLHLLHAPLLENQERATADR